MAEIHITLSDTPSGGVSFHTDFKPAVGQPCTPAQGRALEVINHLRALDRDRALWSTKTEDFCRCDKRPTYKECLEGRCTACGREMPL